MNNVFIQSMFILLFNTIVNTDICTLKMRHLTFKIHVQHMLRKTGLLNQEKIVEMNKHAPINKVFTLTSLKLDLTVGRSNCRYVISKRH